MTDFHFYASSLAEWRTTTPKRDLRKLIKLMDRDGYTYHLFYVPLPHDAEYDISNYRPIVPGALFLGLFNQPKGVKDENQTPLPQD